MVGLLDVLPRFRATVAHDVGVHFGSAFYDMAADTAIGSYAQMALGKLACYTWAQDKFKEAAATRSHRCQLWWFSAQHFQSRAQTCCRKSHTQVRRTQELLGAAQDVLPELNYQQCHHQLCDQRQIFGRIRV